MNKKYFMHLMAIMMVAMLSVGFASCSNDDDEDKNVTTSVNPKDLVGTWGLTHAEGWEIWEGQKETYNDTYDPLNPTSDEDQKMVITNPSGNTLDFVIYEWDEILKKWSDDTKISLTLNGNTIESGSIKMEVLSVTSTQLVLEMSGNTFYEKQTYKKLN